MQSLISKFNNLKISTKLYSSFGLVIAMLLVLSGFALTGVNDLGGIFTEYRSTARESVSANLMMEDLLEARMAVLKFRINDDQQYADEVIGNVEEIYLEEKNFLKLARTQESRQKSEEVLEAAKQYEATFLEAVTLQNKRNELVAVLDEVGPQMRREITEIRETAYAAGDVSSANEAGAANESLLLSRLYAGKFLLNNDPKDRERAIKEFDKADGAFRKLLRGLQNSERRALAISAIEGLQIYRDHFIQASDAILARNELLINGLDQIGPQMAEDLEYVVDKAVDLQNALGPAAAQEVVATKTATIIFSLICVILGACAAILISRMLSASIRDVTDDTNQLAQGNLEFEIHGTDRKDEIGDIAKALQVFQQNMVETKRLEEQQRKAEQVEKERMQRRDAMTQDFEGNVANLLQAVEEAMDSMRGANSSVQNAVSNTNEQTTAIAAAVEEASASVQTVASSTTQMTSSIQEISSNMQKSLQAVTNAVQKVETTDEIVQNMSETSDKIGEVVSMITDIAEQTNLLALNATIESARAGEAGKGFAVVANEVKSLASQTTKSTEEISEQIKMVQGISNESVQAMVEIRKEMEAIKEMISAVTAAVEEQSATTNEISRASDQASQGTQEVSSKVTQVSQGANETLEQSNTMLEAVERATNSVSSLQDNVKSFLKNVSAV